MSLFSQENYNGFENYNGSFLILRDTEWFSWDSGIPKRETGIPKKPRSNKIWLLILGKFPLFWLYLSLRRQFGRCTVSGSKFWDFLYISQFTETISMHLVSTNQTEACAHNRVRQFSRKIKKPPGRTWQVVTWVLLAFICCKAFPKHAWIQKYWSISPSSLRNFS